MLHSTILSLVSDVKTKTSTLALYLGGHQLPAFQDPSI